MTTNAQMQMRMEMIKSLLEGVTERIGVATEDENILLEYVSHLKNIDILYQSEVRWFTNSVPSKERSMEVLALIGFIDLQIKEDVEVISKYLKKASSNLISKLQEKVPGHPLIDLIQQVIKSGGEVHVMDMGAENCTNPDCAIHGKKEAVPKEN